MVRALNIGLRVVFALLLVLFAVNLLAGGAAAVMRVRHPMQFMVYLPSALFALFLGWGAYKLATQARQIYAAEAPAPEAAGSPEAGSRWLMWTGVVALILAGALYQTFKFRPGRGMFRAGLGRQTVGHLGAVRSAIGVYYGSTDGKFPDDVQVVFERGKYGHLEKLPQAQTGMHPPSDDVHLMTGQEYAEGKFSDAGGWFYVYESTGKGTFGVNCTHTDALNKVWNAY